MRPLRIAGGADAGEALVMPEWLKDWWPVVAVTVSLTSPLLTGWIGWSIRNRFVTRDDHEKSIEARQASFGQLDIAIGRLRQETNERLTQTETRLALVERDVSHLPTRQDFERVVGAISKVETNLGRVEAGLESLREGVNRITDHLMNGGAR